MFADYFFLLRASYSKLLGCKTVGYFFFSKLVWRSVRIALEPREPSFHSRLFLTETQSYIDRGRHLEKPRKRLREEGRERGEGEKGRGGERIKYFLYFFLPSPTSILYPSTSPLISVFDSSQLSGSINLQDGGKASFLKKKVMDRAAKYACFAGYASRASLTRPRPWASSLALCFQPRS